MNAHGQHELRPAEGLRGWMWEQLQTRTCCADAWLARGWCCHSCGRTVFDYLVHVRLQEQFVRTEIPQVPSTISEASVETTCSADSDSTGLSCSSQASTAEDIRDHSVRPRFPIDHSVAENHFAATHLPHQDKTETLLGKVVEILDKRGELENCGWIFCGQLNKEIHLILARRMEATTTAYWIQQVYIWQDVSNAREGCWSDDDG